MYDKFTGWTPPSRDDHPKTSSYISHIAVSCDATKTAAVNSYLTNPKEIITIKAKCLPKQNSITCGRKLHSNS